MSITKRLKVVYAALTQSWHQHQCAKCGQTQWVEGAETWSDQSECVPCETKAFEAWHAKQQARQELQQRVKGAA